MDIVMMNISFLSYLISAERPIFGIRNPTKFVIEPEKLKDKLEEERKEKAEYAKKVGQLTMQVDWLKKKSEELCGPDYESKFSTKPFDD